VHRCEEQDCSKRLKSRHTSRSIVIVRGLLLAAGLATLPSAWSQAQEPAVNPPSAAFATTDSAADPTATLDISVPKASNPPDATLDNREAPEEPCPPHASAATNREIAEYVALQNPPGSGQEQLHSSSIGLELRQDTRTLNSGESAEGLLIVGVASGSPAAEAGLRSGGQAVALELTEVAAFSAAFFFPPAILVAAPIIDETEAARPYDLIIGVDGCRVRNLFDFEDLTRDLKRSDIVYLSVVRDGRRMQVTVPLTSMASSPS
jgi:hypothetical protein